MISLEDQIGELHQKEKQILRKINDRNRERKIKCSGCEGYHKIGELSVIQTHWYTHPRGCTGGDYWNEGELNFICLQTGIVNRLLFDNSDVPFEERRVYANNPEEQFKRNYKGLFRKVNESYEESISGKFANNYYIDKNREKFGLVAKRK